MNVINALRGFEANARYAIYALKERYLKRQGLKPTIARKNIILLMGFAGLSLAGCVSILPDPAPADVVYRFVKPGQPLDANGDALVVRIDRPGGANIFETRDILVSLNGRDISAASGAQWADLVPLMLQESLVEHMALQPEIIGVLPSSNARTDTRLYLTIKNFEAFFDQGVDKAPQAIVEYRISLVSAKDRHLINAHIIRQTERAASPRVSAIVSALEQANNRAMTEIIEWLFKQNTQS